MAALPALDLPLNAFRDARRAHWDGVAVSGADRRAAGLAYRRELARVLRTFVPGGARILELGCGQGDLLAALAPREAVGVDLSAEMIARATRRHPDPRFRFVAGDAHDVPIEGTFDAIILSDLLNDAWDAQALLRHVAGWCDAGTRVVLTLHSQVWQLPLRAARAIGGAAPLLEQNWFAPSDVANLLALEGFELVRRSREILCPLPIPLVQPLLNQFVAHLPLARGFDLVNVYVARRAGPPTGFGRPRVSVVVPARNEAGNIAGIMARTPELGGGTELIFVEGGSRDDTWDAIERERKAHPERRTQAIRQTGRGKADAVRAGFAVATGEVLMILDADLSVAPEDLTRFFDVLAAGRGELVNGVRLVYPMAGRAMQFLNLLANKAFAVLFSWVLGQPVKDTLCGTKVLTRRTYDRIAAGRAHFGEFDPFGDFDLLFGAARLGLRITDLPVRYHERTYGSTNIDRWRHGVLLLRMLGIAARRLLFV